MDNLSNNTNYQAGRLFITTIFVVLIWLLHSYNAAQKSRATPARIAQAQARISRRRARTQAQVEMRAPAPFMGTVDEDSDDENITPWPDDLPSSPSEMSLILDSDVLKPPREETPIMRQLAPPGHRPTNAQLEGSPFRVAQRLGHRPGQPATPGFQTPSGPNSSLSQAFPTPSPQHNACSGFSKDAPVSYLTFPGGSVLTGDGTSNHFMRATNAGYLAEFAQMAPVNHDDLQGSTMLNAEGALMQE
ncbi:hypothetical protein DDE82_005889 [Stemphylium lycopersici]|uniref:Uncharacterized protein n=1 Tax=Stemphylium lycopersici TaxID=183478 RepID=A0A364MS69_STELY|nr:hypothetical protein TW65_01646 [Stemphylium lycopersici]RAR01571.1 hypothetical protein DDE83_008873 [Stemphylium lycopersici]RAR02334.1 hypothetical protein DDE82_005889 [Stemphylium lycopersici]